MKISALAIAIVGAGLVGGIPAQVSAQQAVLTGLEDFRIANVGEGLFGVTRRDALNSRFQVNGRNPASGQRNFGLWATFDLELAGLFDSSIGQLDSVRIDLFQVQAITGQTINNVIRGGTMNVYYTLENADVLAAANGFDWIDADPEGLGDQFSDRVLVGSIDLVDQTNVDAGFDLDLSVIGASLINQINAGGFARFVFTTPDMNMATSWGVGVPGTSTVLAFDGPAPTVTFTVPAPGTAGLALLGLGVMARRRRG
jgi:uncharacterized protein (TIGR03382 family)